MDDLLREFLTETSESLGQLDVELVRLEQNPDDPELIGSIFRLVHTIKGTCGFLGLPRLEKIAHASENVLGKFRDRTLDVTPEAVSAILQSLDVIKGLLATLEETGGEPDGDDNVLIARLNAICDGQAAPAAPVAATETVAAAPAASLYERIGGDAAVEAAVNGLYNKILSDPALNRFFAGVDMARQRMMMTAFVATALNGPDASAATDLTGAHARLVADGLSDV
jgi:two-component system chemotaxis sensor kinase CheA